VEIARWFPHGHVAAVVTQARPSAAMMASGPKLVAARHVKAEQNG
jgi:hypothetical protein